MSYSITLPVDNGFIRRECPQCERQFKWHHGPTENRPADAVDPDLYFCPYCGETAAPDSWWTKDQLEYVQQVIAAPATRTVVEDLRRSLENTGGGLFKMTVQSTESEPPPALHEPHDMVLVESPCHPWEPLKIAEEWSSALHCLICGEEFSLG